MRGPGDKCAAMCRTIERAGLKRVCEFARTQGRLDPEKDLAVIRRAAVSGYKNAAYLSGVAPWVATRIVRKYYEFALTLLDGKGG